MTDQLSYKTFTAKDIKNLLGINANTLFYWVQTRRLVKPTIVGRGRGKRNRFSTEDLSNLYLIKALFESGFDLSYVETVLSRINQPRLSQRTERFITPDETLGLVFPSKKQSSVGAFRNGTFEFFNTFNMWAFYRGHKEECQSKGLFLFSVKTVHAKPSFIMSFITDLKGLNDLIKLVYEAKAGGHWLGEDVLSYYAISFMGLIYHIETITGERI